MPQTYNPVLVALSVLVAVWASYEALELAARAGVSTPQARSAWLAAGALAQGIGIWSMHFVGMLALRLPVPVSYSVALITLSVLIAVASCAIAFALVRREVTGRRTFWVAGVCMGAAISGMHYTAMAGMRLAAALRYDAGLVVLSVAIAVAASLAALRLAFRRYPQTPRGLWRQRASVALLGFGIVGMHYTAMAAARFTPVAMAVGSLSGTVPVVPELAIVVTLGTAAMLGMAQLGVVISRREEQVRQTEERFRKVVEEVEEYAIIMLDVAGRVASWNAGAQRIKGYQGAEILGQHYARFHRPEDIAVGKPDRLLSVAAAQGAVKDEGWRVRRDGSRFWANVLITALHDSMGALVGFLKITRDITEHRRVETQMAQYRTQLQALAARSESAREEERTRVAREMHDVLGQALTALKLDLGWLARTVPQPSAQADKIRSMSALLDDTVEALRRVAAELRPPLLDELGLGAAVETLAEEFASRTGIAAAVRVTGDDEDLDPSLGTVVYRILQEALTNVARHAQASRVDIVLEVTPHQVTLEVRDNGRGITEDQLDDARSLGLLGMRERALSRGGDVSVTGGAGQGTVVRARLPR